MLAICKNKWFHVAQTNVSEGQFDRKEFFLGVSSRGQGGRDQLPSFSRLAYLVYFGELVLLE